MNTRQEWSRAGDGAAGCKMMDMNRNQDPLFIFGIAVDMSVGVVAGIVNL